MTMMRRWMSRGSSDRGSVGVLMALFLMVAIGSLVMTWNTVQLSKEKMRLQTAADAAALSACVWQARGMNAVQNINDDMYILLSISIKLIKIATPIQALACGFWALRYAPFVGAIFEVVGGVMFGVALLLGGTSAWMADICRFILHPLGLFYGKVSALLGFWGAQQLAAKNGATRIVLEGASGNETWGDWGIFAAGTTYPAKNLFILPLDEKDTKDAPWYYNSPAGKLSDILKKLIEEDDSDDKDEAKKDIWTSKILVPSWIATVHKILKTGKSWSFKPFVSPTNGGVATLPTPVLFMVRRESEYLETINMKWWDKNFSSRPAGTTPMMAVAAAQCITGDVIAHSKSPSTAGSANNRPAGFGTGATARLIPIREYADLKGETKVKKGVFH